MTTATTVGPRGRLAVGILFMSLGLVLTLDQAGILNLDGLGRFWPLFLIGIGVVKVRQPMEDGQRAVGTALLLTGGFFQVLSLLNWGRGWPVVLILVGGLFLWQAVERPQEPPPPPPATPFVSEFVLLGGSKRIVRLADFRGGYVTAVMGGVELDLRNCRIGASPAVLDVVAFWGGIDLKVPAEWRVETSVVPFMGGFEQKTTPLAESEAAPRLVVRGYSIMGGVIVGN